MIPDQLDPLRHPAQALPPQLDDGCSPPGTTVTPPQPDAAPGEAAPVDPALWVKSEF